MPRRATRSLAAASEPAVLGVAEAVLFRGNAVDAVVAAVFAAAAIAPSVLLGPVQLLVGGAGSGLRAVDGRTRQPGLGAPRPRGFLPGEPVPAAATVAVPTLPAALSVTLASFGSVSLARTVAPALEIRRPSTPRGAVIKRIAQRGPAALADPRIEGELVAAAGRAAGGLLGPRDLAEVRPGTAACTGQRAGELTVITVPWGAEAVRDKDASPLDGRRTRVVVCADPRGLFAAAAYEESDEGLAIPELDLVAPAQAAPVLRGETRVRPGTPRPAAAPLALAESGKKLLFAAGIGAERHAERVLGAWLRAYEGVIPPDPRILVTRA